MIPHHCARPVREPLRKLLSKARPLFALGMSLTILCSAMCQSKSDSPHSRGVYSNAKLAFRYTTPLEMRDKTARFPALQIDNSLAGTPQTLSTLLAMSSGPDSGVSTWRSVTIVTYPRSAVSETDDAKAEARMNAWVAHSKDATALPRSVVISGQRFSVALFGLQEGTVKKGAVVWTTVRKGKLLSFAFVANSSDRLKALAETMKTVQFF
jgi:hypothetical protein